MHGVLCVVVEPRENSVTIAKVSGDINGHTVPWRAASKGFKPGKAWEKSLAGTRVLHENNVSMVGSNQGSKQGEEHIPATQAVVLDY